MPDKHQREHLKLWTPATYRIDVEGFLDESWSERLGGIEIRTLKREDQSWVTTLTGRVRDQAELAGILNSLYEMHLPVLLVKNLSDG